MDIQQEILGPVLSMLVINLMFSLKSSYSFLKESFTWNLVLEVDFEPLMLRVLSLRGLILTPGNFLELTLGPVV